MGRDSQDKIIEEDKKNEELKKRYLKQLEELKASYDVNEDQSYANLVNFSENKEEPVHKWFEYKEGYSSKLVERLIEEDELSDNGKILDPFTGSGTTNVVAQRLGYQSVGVDILPISVLLSRVKTYDYSEEELNEIKNYIKNIEEGMVMTDKVPEFKVLERMFFSEEDKETMLELKGFWESIENQRVRDFFRLAYISILERVSNRKKDGNGIKYYRSKDKIEDIVSYYENKLFKMYSDLLKKEENAKAKILEGSIIDEDVQEEVSQESYESVIFSPPYANCFDYCEVYKMEMWLGGFVEGYRDFDQYREGAVRSHVNSKFDHSTEYNFEFVDIATELISTYNIWNDDIPPMLRGYFDDMAKTLKFLFKVMDEDAECKIVVANSGYKGVLIPTDLILSEIGESIGFEVDEIVYTREIRASSQQMEELHEDYDELMRESIVKLKKKSVKDLTEFEN